jgi:hypothetical protein
MGDDADGPVPLVRHSASLEAPRGIRKDKEPPLQALRPAGAAYGFTCVKNRGPRLG